MLDFTIVIHNFFYSGFSVLKVDVAFACIGQFLKKENPHEPTTGNNKNTFAIHACVKNYFVPSLKDFVASLNDLVPSLKDLVPSLNNHVPSLNNLLPSLNDVLMIMIYLYLYWINNLSFRYWYMIV